MTDTAAPVLFTLTAHVFPLDGRPGSTDEDLTWDIIHQEVYYHTVELDGPRVYKCPDRDGNSLTIIAYPLSIRPDTLVGIHVIWQHRDIVPSCDCC